MWWDRIIVILLSIPGMILYFSFRGFFQALVAKKLGDTMPERNGFLTMNPLAHINPFGFLLILLVGFGFGKPVQFDPSCYKHPKRDGAIQILSAPLAGIIVGLALYTFYFIFYVIGHYSGILSNDFYHYFMLIFLYGFHIAISLTVFHLLPLPGLDTYRLVVNFLPYRIYRKFFFIEKYSFWIYIAFLLILRTPVVGDFLVKYLLTIPSNAIIWLLSRPFAGLAMLLNI